MTKKKPTKPKPQPTPTNNNRVEWLSIYTECSEWAKINFQEHYEDVMQQTFLNLLERDTVPDNPTGYFRTCAYHEYLRIIRPKPVHFMVEVETDKIMIEELHQVINHLTWFDRHVFNLHFIQGMPIVRIARLTSIPTAVLYDSLLVSKTFIKNAFA